MLYIKCEPQNASVPKSFQRGILTVLLIRYCSVLGIGDIDQFIKTKNRSYFSLLIFTWEPVTEMGSIALSQSAK